MPIKLRKVLNVKTETYENRKAMRIFCLILFGCLSVLIPVKVSAGVNHAQISCKSTSLKAAPRREQIWDDDLEAGRIERFLRLVFRKSKGKFRLDRIVGCA